MVYLFLASGFEETEAIVPVDILRRGGVNLITVGIGKRIITSDRGLAVIADQTDEELPLEGMEMVVLPGGKGHLVLRDSKTVKSAVGFAFENDRYVAAICASPTVLDAFRFIDNRQVTCFPAMSEQLVHAKFLNQPVVKDGKLITAMGAAYSADFAFELLRVLKGEETVAQVRGNMLFKDNYEAFGRR